MKKLKEINDLPAQDTYYDLVVKYLKDPANMPELSFPQKKMLVRFNFAKALLQAHPYWSLNKISSVLQREFRIGYTTAFYDVKTAYQAVGFEYIDEKNYWKEFLTKECLKGMELAISQSRPNLKAHAEYVKRLIDIKGLRIDEESRIKKEDYGPQNVFILIKSSDGSFYKQLDKLEENDPEVIDTVYEEVLEQNQLIIPEDESDQATSE